MWWLCLEQWQSIIHRPQIAAVARTGGISQGCVTALFAKRRSVGLLNVLNACVARQQASPRACEVEDDQQLGVFHVETWCYVLRNTGYRVLCCRAPVVTGQTYIGHDAAFRLQSRRSNTDELHTHRTPCSRSFASSRLSF